MVSLLVSTSSTALCELAPICRVLGAFSQVARFEGCCVGLICENVCYLCCWPVSKQVGVERASESESGAEFVDSSPGGVIAGVTVDVAGNRY